jgi:hypothetical protein
LQSSIHHIDGWICPNNLSFRIFMQLSVCLEV